MCLYTCSLNGVSHTYLIHSVMVTLYLLFHKSPHKILHKSKCMRVWEEVSAGVSSLTTLHVITKPLSFYRHLVFVETLSMYMSCEIT